MGSGAKRVRVGATVSLRMDSADPKSTRSWRTHGTFQERSTRTDRVTVAVQDTHETGNRSTSGLAVEARAAVKPAIARVL